MAETLTIRKPIHERDNRDHADKVANALAAQRKDHEDDWHKIADFSGYGEVEGIRYTDRNTKRPKMRELMDSHPIKAFRTVEAGMYSGLSSPNRPWLDFKFADDDLNNYQPAMEWLDDFKSVIIDMFAASNFYQQARQNYGEMARFGPACGVMTEHWRSIAPTFAIPIGQFWFGLDDAMEVRTLVRNMPMTVSQVVEKFVAGPGGQMNWSKVSVQIRNAWDNSNYGDMIQCKQLIEPGMGEQWNSIIWDDQCDSPKRTLEEKHFNEQSFWGARWAVRGNDPYGKGCGHDALADMRELHMQNKRKRELTDLLAKPPTMGPAQKVGMKAGDHTSVREVGPGMQVVPIYQVNPQALAAVRDDIMELRQSIDALAFADLFMAISQMPGVQPRTVEELIKRDEERLTQIGPVVEMVNDDMLPVAVDRMIGIARRGGLIPPAPEELQGRALKTEFVSVLAMAQKMMGMSQTERFVGFVGSLGQVLGPDVLDKIDGDALVDDYADRINVPAKTVRDSVEVERMRAERKQAQQAEQMAAMAAPAKDATTAALNIAEMSNETESF